jgi:dTDP-4-amino-4,6-dideoxygalactose transaminase
LQPGFNYRLSDINCALALSQLSRIKDFINYRKKIYIFYKKKLSKLSNFLFLPNYNKKNLPSYHLFIVLINFQKLQTSKDQFLTFLKRNKIISQYHYIPIYRFKMFKKKYYFKNFNSEAFFKNAVSIPIYFNLKRKQQLFVIKKIKSFFKSSSK